MKHVICCSPTRHDNNTTLIRNIRILNDSLLSSPPHIKLFVWYAPAGSYQTFEEATNASNKYKETVTGNEFKPS